MKEDKDAVYYKVEALFPVESMNKDSPPFTRDEVLQAARSLTGKPSDPNQDHSKMLEGVTDLNAAKILKSLSLKQGIQTCQSKRHRLRCMEKSQEMGIEERELLNVEKSIYSVFASSLVLFLFRYKIYVCFWI